MVRFPSATGAQVFLQAAQHSLESGEIVSKGPLPSVPGARLVTYFAATNESGVGEAITMRAGIYVALLSFFSAAAGNSQPITPADAEKVALAQHSLLGVGVRWQGRDCSSEGVAQLRLLGPRRAGQEERFLQRHRVGDPGRRHRCRCRGDAAVAAQPPPAG